jgi:hypothetical protein
VNQGGDADTTGAIAGAIAGAYYGAAEIPRRWVKKLDKGLVLEIERLAERLVELAPVTLASHAVEPSCEALLIVESRDDHPGPQQIVDQVPPFVRG